MSYEKWQDENTSRRSSASETSLKFEPSKAVEDVNSVGRFRSISNIERSEILFMISAFISIVGAGVITIIRINNSNKNTGDFTFAVLLLVNLIFISAYIVHGILGERPFEILVSVSATVVVVLYCIIEYSLYGQGNTIKLVRLIGVCVIGPIDVGLGIYVAKGYFESKNLIFRTVGANIDLQEICQTMLVFSAFLLFDLQIVFSLLVLILNGGIKVDLLQQLILGLGVPFSVFWVVLGFALVRFEKKAIALVFWLLSACEPAYIIYLFVKAGKEVDTLSSSDAQYDQKKLLDICIISAGVLGLIVRIVLMGLSFLVVRNFGKGLRKKVFNDTSESTD